MSYFVDTIYFVIRMPEISSPISMQLDRETQENLDAVNAGLQAMKAKKLNFDDTDLDPQYARDLGVAIAQNRLAEYLAAIPKTSPKLQAIVVAMKNVREFVDTWNEDAELAVS